MTFFFPMYNLFLDVCFPSSDIGEKKNATPNQASKSTLGPKTLWSALEGAGKSVLPQPKAPVSTPKSVVQTPQKSGGASGGAGPVLDVGLGSSLSKFIVRLAPRLAQTKKQVLDEIASLSKVHLFQVHEHYEHALPGAFCASLDSDQLDALTDLDVVHSVEPDLPVQACAQQVDWGVARVGGTKDSVRSGDGQGDLDAPRVHVFVLDTGVTHPDVLVVENRSFVGTSAADENGHGTFCAGVIGARDNTSYTVGLAPGVQIHNYRVLDAAGSGSLSGIVSAMNAVVQWRSANPAAACVVSMSLGLSSPQWNALDAVIQNAIVAHGITVCVAAGNSGTNAAQTSPAHVPEALTVGAYDTSNRLASWSNWGPAVDLLAPGVNILSLWPSGPSGVGTLSGTSMATPCVAGMAALYLSRNPDASPATVKAALVSAAKAAMSAGTNAPINVAGRPGTTNVSAWVGSF